jgi:beta-lactamase class A
MRGFALSIASLLCAAGLRAQTPKTFAHADTSALRHTLDAIAAAHHGILGYSVLNLDTGEHLSLRGDETFPTASLIKVPILVTLYDLAGADDHPE